MYRSRFCTLPQRCLGAALVLRCPRQPRKLLTQRVHAGRREMLDTPGPYLLEVVTPHIEHVLPM